MSPDPPENHQRTAARRHASKEAVPASHGEPEEAAVGAFFDALADRSERWLLSASQRRRLAPAVAAAVAVGWTTDGLAQFAGANTC